MTRHDFPTKLLIVAALATCCTALSRGLLVSARPGDEPSPATVAWEGHTLKEVTALADLPATIQSVLHVGSSGIGGIADRGGNYNPTDFVNPKLPMRRFVVGGVSVAGAGSTSIAAADKAASNAAGANSADSVKTSKGKAGGYKSIEDNDIALVALEYGGIALRVEVTLYSHIQSKPVVTRTWTVYSTPKTLRDLVDQLTSASKKTSH